MTNFATATNATTTALNSSGSAAEENARYLESIEARATAVSAAFQQMSLKVVDSDLVKGILDIVKAFAQFGSTDIGSTITQITLLSGASWGGLQLLGQSILPGIIGGFKAFSSVLKGVTLEATAASLGFKSALSAGLAATLPVILGVTTAIVALVAIIKGIKSAYEEANPSVEQAYANMQEANEELTSTEKKYTETKEKLDKLNATPYADRTAEMQAEIEKLETLIEYYEQLLQLTKEESKEATASYVAAVEKEGLSTGRYYGTVTRYETPDEFSTTILGSYQELTDIYASKEAATTAAILKEKEYSGVLEDTSSIEKRGWAIKEEKISVQDYQESLNNLLKEMSKQQTLTPSLISQYKELSSIGKKYAEVLIEQKENGEELNTSEISFLKTWEEAQKAYEEANKRTIRLNEKYLEISGQLLDITDNNTQKIRDSASALSEFAQSLLSASTAYEDFKNKLSATGDYDDSFKGLVSVFGELNSEWEKGQTGSQAFLTALELLTGKTFQDSASATEYLNTHLDTLSLLFNDSESGGLGLIAAIQDLQENTDNLGASVKEDLDGNLEVTIDDFSKLAENLGISEGSLFSLTKAAKIFGVDFEYNVDSVLSTVEELGEGIVTLDDNIKKVNFEEFAKQAKEAGMSTDEIAMIGEILADASGVELSNVTEGLALLSSNSDDASANAEDLTDGLNNIGGTSSGIDSTASSVSSLSDNLSNASGYASSLYTSLSGISNLKFPSLFSLIGGFAEGTNYAEEGDSLVNEEGPELIQSKDKAYIAGGGLPTITHLHRGDKVYTADETEDILNGKTIDSIPAHKDGAGIKSAKTTISKDIGSKIQKISKTDKQSGGSSSSSASSTSTSSASKPAKEEFDEWLKAKKHALTMDEITEKEYYEELEKMNEKYFKNSEEYRDEYWKYQEEVYKWRKNQLEDENDLLQKQIDLEKALSDLAKAKEQKILVYKDGRFQYIQDIDAIDEAQRNVAKLKSEVGYASGTTNASAGIHLVGENGPELRVLNSGDGIIPADTTKNLLNLAQMNGAKLGDGLNKAMQILYSFDISNLSLPNVRNATEFFEGLKNYAYQYSYAQ